MKRFASPSISVLCGTLALSFAGYAWVSPRSCRAQEGGGEASLPLDDQRFLADFSQALQGFKEMPIEAFLEEYGPKKQYLKGQEGSFIRGDSTGDGRLDITDAICILADIFFTVSSCGNPLCMDARDANDDGKVDITDPIHVLRYLFLGGPAPSPPFPEAGTDTTSDPIDCLVARPLDYDPGSSEYLDLIANAYPLNTTQRAAFDRYGFVIAKDKKFATFFQALKEIFAKDLPVYISADSILDSVHLSFDRILLDIEENLLVDQLDLMLKKMDDGIEDLQAHSGGVDIADALDDVAFWVGTARSLLQGGKVACKRGVDAAVEKFLGYVSDELPRDVSLFGAPVSEDFSQFNPRGHYTRSEALQRYFKTLMWTQRIGMRFTESKRQAAVAFLLTKSLLETGALAQWKVIDGVVEVLVGSSDSLNPEGMSELLKEARVVSAADLEDDSKYGAFVELARTTGAGRQLINSMLLLGNPYAGSVASIPAAFHVMGQRFIVDSFVFSNVVYDRVQSPHPRTMPSPLDAWFVLGNRATVPLLKSEIDEYQYQPHLAALDWIVSRYPEEFWNRNLYNLWLSALKTLAVDTTGPSYPPALRTVAWDRRMLQAQLGSWAHLRHDTILYTKQSYTFIFCEYPDAWVDPYPEFFEKLQDYAAKALEGLGARGIFELEGSEEGRLPGDPPPFHGFKVRRYFERLSTTLLVLKDIARTELSGEPLADAQAQFLKSCVRSSRACGAPDFDGWYTDLLYDYSDMGNAAQGGGNAETFDPTIADVHTDPNLPPRFLHVGVGHPSLMVLSVKNDCGIKAYAGPVLSYHELIAGERLTDETWKAELESGREMPRPDWVGDFVK